MTEKNANLQEVIELDLSERVRRQLAFLVEIDRLKTVLRQARIMNEERYENSAEHSWHLCLMALTLAEHAKEPVNVARVLEMTLVHDLVEIDAGDTFAYDEAGYLDKREREERAAERIFGLLPPDQAASLRAAWDEFEAQETPESRYANAMDRLAGMLANCHTGGHSWHKHGVPLEKVMQRNSLIAEHAPNVWECVAPLAREVWEAGKK